MYNFNYPYYLHPQAVAVHFVDTFCSFVWFPGVAFGSVNRQLMVYYTYSLQRPYHKTVRIFIITLEVWYHIYRKKHIPIHVTYLYNIWLFQG